MDRPNVLMLYTDQQRWDTIRCTGNDYIYTPNLDRLAEGGAWFRNAFCNSPVCMPSRQSLLSGRYPSAVGTTCNGIEMPEDVECIHNVLNLYDYHTANLGKLHFKNHSNRDHREAHPSYGFDELVLSDEPGCYDDAYIKWVAERAPDEVEHCRVSTPPAWTGKPVTRHPRGTTTPYLFEGPEELTHTAFVADQTIRTIRRHREEPFFAIAGFYAPHAPINPPRRFVEMYDPATLPLPLMNPDENGLGLSDEAWRTVKAYYYAFISHIDDQIGRILTALDDEGLSDNTLVLFTADHGEHLGDHGKVAKGAPGLDSCSHVPLLVRYPRKIAPGQAFDALIEGVDLAPTILDYCGVQAPPAMQGRSFRPLLEGRPYEERASVYLEHRYPFGASWKVARTHEHWYAACNSEEELLFDLCADPHQLRNVAADPSPREALQAMRAELMRRWFDVERQYPKRMGAY